MVIKITKMEFETVEELLRYEQGQQQETELPKPEPKPKFFKVKYRDKIKFTPAEEQLIIDWYQKYKVNKNLGHGKLGELAKIMGRDSDHIRFHYKKMVNRGLITGQMLPQPPPFPPPRKNSYMHYTPEEDDILRGYYSNIPKNNTRLPKKKMKVLQKKLGRTRQSIAARYHKLKKEQRHEPHYMTKRQPKVPESFNGARLKLASEQTTTKKPSFPKITILTDNGNHNFKGLLLSLLEHKIDKIDYHSALYSLELKDGKVWDDHNWELFIKEIVTRMHEFVSALGHSSSQIMIVNNDKGFYLTNK